MLVWSRYLLWGLLLIIRTAIIIVVLIMRTATISSLSMLIPYKTLPPLKSKSGQEPQSLSRNLHIKRCLIFQYCYHQAENKPKIQGRNPLYEEFVRISTTVVIIDKQSISKYHIDHKRKQNSSRPWSNEIYKSLILKKIVWGSLPL